jgi:hypothetical protein
MTEENYSNVGHRGPVYKGLGATNPCDLSKSVNSVPCVFHSFSYQLLKALCHEHICYFTPDIIFSHEKASWSRSPLKCLFIKQHFIPYSTYNTRCFMSINSQLICCWRQLWYTPVSTHIYIFILRKHICPPLPISVDRILNYYGLGGLWFKPRCERDFQDPSRMAPRPAQSPVRTGTASSSQVKSGRGLALISHSFLGLRLIMGWSVISNSSLPAHLPPPTSNTKVTHTDIAVPTFRCTSILLAIQKEFIVWEWINVIIAVGNIGRKYSRNKSYLMELVPWNRILADKLIVAQLLENSPTYFGIRQFINILTVARRFLTSWAKQILSK